MIKVIIGVIATMVIVVSILIAVLNFKARIRLQKRINRLKRVINERDLEIFHFENQLEPRNMIVKTRNNVDPEEIEKMLEEQKLIFINDDIEIEYLEDGGNKIESEPYKLLKREYEKMKELYSDSMEEIKRLEADNKKIKRQAKMSERVAENREEMFNSLSKALKELDPDLKVKHIVDINNK